MHAILRCPLGHEWVAEMGNADAEHCPECGAAPAVVEEMDDCAEGQDGTLAPVGDSDRDGSTLALNGDAPRDRTGIIEPSADSARDPTSATLDLDGLAYRDNHDPTANIADPGFSVGPSAGSDAWSDASQMPASGLDATHATIPNRKPETPNGRKAVSGPNEIVMAKRVAVTMPAKIAGYEILGELGRGGMGVVYKARQAGLNRVCALKMIVGGSHAGADALARFRIEAEAIAHLQHPNIVQVYEIGEEAGCPFFSLEFVEGASLADKIEGTPQAARDAAKLMTNLCAGMQAAHQRGIIHRDLKPANILLAADGTPKITDFGLAKRFEDQDHGQTRTGAIMGTPSYMAPEQAQGRIKDLGPAADIYALGAILYDLLTGRPPFRGETVMETLSQVQNLEPLPPVRIQPKVPLDLQTICLKALQKDPKKRYETAGAMGEDLCRFLAGEPILARPTSAWERCIKWIKRHPASATLIAVSGLALVSILAFGFLWLNSERQAAIDREDQQTKLAQTETAARLEAERLKLLADEQRDAAEKQRQRAESNFQHAQDAVNEMLTGVAAANLAIEPRMEAVRRDLLEKALAFYLKFLADQSSDTTTRYETAAAFHRVADINRSLGKLAVADANYRQAIQRFQELTKDRQEKQWLKELASATLERGLVLQLLGHNLQSEKAFREAVGLFERLARAEPEETFYQEELSNLHQNLANLNAAAGRLDLAEKDYDTALTLREALSPLLGGIAAYRQRLARVQAGRGAILFLVGKNGPAETSLVNAKNAFAALMREQPDYPDYMADAANASLNLGLFYRKTNRGPQALASLQQAIDWYQTLTNRYPLTLTYRQKLAQSVYELGMLYGAANNLQEAYLQLGKALKLQKALPASFAQQGPVRLQTAQCEISLGIACVGLNKLDEALAHYKAAIDWLEAAKPSAKTDVEACKELCRGLFNQAELFRGLKKYPEAERSWARLLELREDLVRAFPESAENRVELALVREDYAGRYLRADKFAEARQQAAAAADQWAAAVALLPRDAAVRQKQYDTQLLLARAEIGSADYQAAAKALSAAKGAPPPTDRKLPTLAALFGQCMLLADRDATLDDEQRHALSKEYGDHALAAIREAVAGGFMDVSFLTANPEFELLRMRSEFKQLVAELGGKK